MKKLTKPQLKMLQLCAIERQSTRRSGVARVQNSLRTLGLVRFTEEDGSSRPLSLILVMASYGNPRPWCEITEAGKVKLSSLAPKRKVDVHIVFRGTIEVSDADYQTLNKNGSGETDVNDLSLNYDEVCNLDGQVEVSW